MTEHPEDLLAEYVDGTLAPEDRARVDAHVTSCDRCREEIALAGEARATLRSAEQLPAPVGIGLAVQRLIRRPSRATRWGAAVAAAVLFIAGGTAVVLSLRGDSAGDVGGGEARVSGPTGQTDQVEEGAEDEQQNGPPEAPESLGGGRILPTYSETDRDYDFSSLGSLGRRLADRARSQALPAEARTTADYFRGFEPASFPPRVREAILCVLRDVPPEEPAVPFTIELARFDGIPAYVATVLQGPAPDLPHDRLLIWAVDRETCALLSFARQKL